MAVFKFCMRNSSFYLALFPVNIFHKQWSLMNPGLQWVCLCPCTSCCSTLAWHCFSKAMSCLCPSAYPQYVLWHEKLGVLWGLLQRFSYPSSPLPLLPAGKPLLVVTVWHPGVLAGWHLINSASHVGVSSLCSSRSSFPSLVQALERHMLSFPGLDFSQACLKLVSEFMRCDWHFHWSAFFRERVKNLLHRFKSLVTVVLKHWNPA